MRLSCICFAGLAASALLFHGAFADTNTDDDKRAGNARLLEATITQFKDRNQIKEVFDFNAHLEMISGTYLHLGHEKISIEKQDLTPITVFTEGAKYYMNGEEQPDLPPPAVFRSKRNPSWKITKTDAGVQQASIINPSTGESIELLSAIPGSGMFVAVSPSDIDEGKLGNFKFGEAEKITDHPRKHSLHRSGERRRVLDTSKKHLRSLQAPCSSFQVIEVASKS